MDLINTLLISSMVINTIVALIVYSRRDGADSTVFIALSANIILWTLLMVVFRQIAGTPHTVMDTPPPLRHPTLYTSAVLAFCLSVHKSFADDSALGARGLWLHAGVCGRYSAI